MWLRAWVIGDAQAEIEVMSDAVKRMGVADNAKSPENKKSLCANRRHGGLCCPHKPTGFEPDFPLPSPVALLAAFAASACLSAASR